MEAKLLLEVQRSGTAHLLVLDEADEMVGSCAEYASECEAEYELDWDPESDAGSDSDSDEWDPGCGDDAEDARGWETSAAAARAPP